MGVPWPPWSGGRHTKSRLRRRYGSEDIIRGSECGRLLGEEPGQPERRDMLPVGVGRRTWWSQLVATVKRNVTIKRRQKRRTAAEIFTPIYIFAILAIVRAVQPETRYAAVTAPHGAASVLSADSVPPLELHVVPSGDEQKEFTDRLLAKLAAQGAKLLPAVFNETEAELEALGRAPPHELVAGLILPANPRVNFSYTLRMDPRLPLPTGRWTGDDQCRGVGADGGLQKGGCPANLYFYTGFLMLQNAIDALHMEDSLGGGSTVELTNMTMVNGPKLEADGGSTTFLQIFVPLYMAISLSQFITYLLTLIVGEKEAKIKDGLKLMGLRDSVYWSVDRWPPSGRNCALRQTEPVSSGALLRLSVQ